LTDKHELDISKLTADLKNRCTLEKMMEANTQKLTCKSEKDIIKAEEIAKCAALV
jgi:hypothetical protein